MISGILAGWIAFKRLRKNTLKLGLIGLSNCLSLIGLLITTIFINTKETNKEVEQILTEIKQKGYFWKRKLAAILLLINLPFLLFSLFAPGLMLVPVVVLIFSLIIKRIKPEDKSLFDQLELNNYSSWSFQPKDKAKIIFVPLFSISFLIISWLLVELIKFTA